MPIPDVEDGVAIIRGGRFADPAGVGALEDLSVAEGPEVTGRRGLQRGRGEAHVNSVLGADLSREVGQQADVAAVPRKIRDDVPVVGLFHVEPDRVAVREGGHRLQKLRRAHFVAQVGLGFRIPGEGPAEDLVGQEPVEGQLRR